MAFGKPIAFCLAFGIAMWLVAGQTTPKPVCTANGVFAGAGVDCFGCQFYTCVYYRTVNRWILRPGNCSVPLGMPNSTQVYFDAGLRRCAINTTVPSSTTPKAPGK